MKRILLVEPNFPIPTKSKNHKNFLPIGLLKLYEYHKHLGHQTKLIRGNKKKDEIGARFIPDTIMITSLFTYWSNYVWETVEFYRKNYSSSEIIIGGIYASLMGDTLEFKKLLKKFNAKVHFGVHKKTEIYIQNKKLNYSILNNSEPIDYQIIHASRGCPRQCKFCGTWMIEPDFRYKKSIKNEISMRKLVFYDNNLLLNPYIEDILNELIELKKKKEILWCESQSGFDGRILVNKPHLAKMLKQSGFQNSRIAWDGKLEEQSSIKKQLDILASGGFRYEELYVFMIYNWDSPFEEMEEKRMKCWEWNVQISDCRYRPLNQTFDNYDSFRPNKIQTSKNYFIHEKWTDSLVKQFRKNVRKQNICVRQHVPFYSKKMERLKIKKEIYQKIKNMKRKKIESYLTKLEIGFWYPDNITYPDKNYIQLEIESIDRRIDKRNIDIFTMEKPELA